MEKGRIDFFLQNAIAQQPQQKKALIKPKPKTKKTLNKKLASDSDSDSDIDLNEIIMLV